MSAETFGGGGPHGARVYWPAGLEQLTPRARAEALARGYWADGDHIVTRAGERYWLPLEAEQLRKEDDGG